MLHHIMSTRDDIAAVPRASLLSRHSGRAPFSARVQSQNEVPNQRSPHSPISLFNYQRKSKPVRGLLVADHVEVGADGERSIGADVLNVAH